MILDEYKSAFIHINKTAGSSIEKVFGKVGKSPTHNDLKFFKKLINTDDYFIFSFVRNPFDKMVSQWSHRVQNIVDPQVLGVSFKEWMLNLDELNFDIKGTGNQIAWLSTQSWTWDTTRKIYTDRPINPKVEIDFVGRFENLQNDWKVIQKELNIDFELPHRRKSNHNHYREYYDDETKKIVYTRFEDDLNYFNYDF